jgi:diacylglycerol kinase (ATP)
MSDRTLVILNPQSGTTRRRWPKLESKLRAALGPFELERTRSSRDAVRIAREAVRAGLDRLVVAGGDGTLSEVVSGLLSADLGRYAQLGVLPLGTGGDFVRSLGGSGDLGKAIAALGTGGTRTIDAGRITYQTHLADAGSDVSSEADREVTSYFANVASFGLSGLVDELVNRSTKALGGRIAFLMGTIRALAQYRSEQVSILVDGNLVYEGGLVFAAAANGQFFGGGMRVAPNARFDDGKLDLVVVPHRSKLRLAAQLPSLYRGSHVNDPINVTARGTVVEASAAPGRVRLDVDGEPLGSLPARIESLPGALTLFGVENSSEGTARSQAAERAPH